MDIYLEIFGYIGTALVILSMMMKSIGKLRIVNSIGGTISMIYSAFVNAWPIVVTNACIIAINTYQLISDANSSDSSSKAQQNTTKGNDNETYN